MTTMSRSPSCRAWRGSCSRGHQARQVRPPHAEDPGPLWPELTMHISAHSTCNAVVCPRIASQAGALCAGPVLLVAVEKRINFTLRDCAATAHACDYFRSLFRSQPLGGSAALAGGTEHAGMQLEGQQIPVDAIPQRHIHRRPDAMELWRLRWAGQHSLG